MVGVSVSKVAKVLVYHEGEMYPVITAYRKVGKIASDKHQRARKYVLTDRDIRSLHRILIKNKKFTAAKMTVELNTVALSQILLAPKQYAVSSTSILILRHSQDYYGFWKLFLYFCLIPVNKIRKYVSFYVYLYDIWLLPMAFHWCKKFSNFALINFK